MIENRGWVFKHVAALTVVAGLVGAGVAASPADTAGFEPQAPLALRYSLNLGGVPIATMQLHIDNSGEVYVSRMSARTRGVLDTVVRYRGEMAAATTVPPPAIANGVEHKMLPRHFEASYSTRRYSRDILLTYEPETGEILELTNLKRGEEQEPRVDDALTVDTVDPLSALLQLRQDLETAVSGGPERFTARVFDGRRRYDLKAEYLGVDRVRVGGSQQDVLRLEVTMTPLAGFNRRDLLANWTDEDQRSIEVLVSNDGRYVPLHIASRGGTLTSTASLIDDCRDPDACPF